MTTTDTQDTFEDVGPDDVFAQFLADGKFMLQRSRSSGDFCFPPRAIAPGTGAADLDWLEVSGRGIVYSTTTVSQRPEKGGPYNVALIELAEGPRMMSRVVDIASDDVRIGMEVAARITEIDGAPTVEFIPAGAV